MASASSDEAFQVRFTDINSLSDWNNVLIEANESQKLIFISAYTDWCVRCKELDERIFTDADLAEYFNQSFLNVKLNVDDKVGLLIAEKLNIERFPSMLFTSSEELNFERVDEFVEVDGLMAYALKAESNKSIWPKLSAKVRSGELSKDDYLDLINIVEKTSVDQAKGFAEDYFDLFTKEDYQKLENFWLLTRYKNDVNSPQFEFIKGIKSQIIEWHGASEYFNYMSAAYNDNLNLAIKYGDRELVEQIITEVLPELVEKDGMPQALFSTRSVFFAQREEFEKYQMEVNSFLNNHLSRESQIPFILSTSYDILENYGKEENLSFVDRLLNRGLVIDKNSFEVMSLLGYVKALQGYYSKANELLADAELLTTNKEEEEMIANLKEAVDILRSGN